MKKTLCDVCETVIVDGENAGLRNMLHTNVVAGKEIEVQTVARVGGNSDADLCLGCLRKAVGGYRTNEITPDRT